MTGRSTVVVIQDSQVFARSSAALRVLAVMDPPWRLFATFYLIPTPLRDFVYRVVGHNRYAIFGRKEQCMTPSGDFKRRFLEYNAADEEEVHPIFK
ncbi:DCC family protein, chloroplastic [Symbiodinium microadriaticum]|uniref:DCC family protein, chloroplastic n=1 Tax=Symbiodinium microadriaticum TaxID=2951 RepID=A0A1Q9EH46_SYMMI|nr:DCC family protein, chloroplastic [Symbiodinium microadriaticum]